MKKRHFLLGAVAGAGALAVGWGVVPPRQRVRPGVLRPGWLNGYVAIGADDTVRIAMARSEMGQGVHTGLAMVLADELDADWARVRLEAAPVDPIFNNVASVVDALPFHPDEAGPMGGRVKQLSQWLTAKAMREIGLMVTGGSSSVKDLWLPMREAGAAARAMLAGAAAAAWGVPAREVAVSAGVLSHPSGRSARFGEMADAAARQPWPEHLTLKTHAQFKLVGKPVKRLEAAAKGSGSATFGLDVLLPGLQYATVAMCPVLGGGVKAFDDAAARRLPGFVRALAVPGLLGGTAGVAVVADTPWHAIAAAKALTVQWDDAVPAAAFDSAAELERLSQTLAADRGAGGFAFFTRGDAGAALSGAAKTISAEYRAPYLAHATLEPQNCTVRVADGRAEVWAPTQVPDLARRAAARALGLSSDEVTVHVQLLGGGFGRRLDVDFVAQAAAIAKDAGGAPVQTFWTREEDTRHDFYRPATVALMHAGFDAQRRLVAWQATSAGASVTQQVLQRVFGLPSWLTAMPDKTTAEGAFDQPYAWPAARVAHVTTDTPVPVGFWRSVGHSHQAFFKEGFIDECAHAAGRDPVAFRAGLLGHHPRALNVLQRVAALAGWGAPPPAGHARGVALHASFGSVVAQVAEVSVLEDQTIRVHRIDCVVDCGTAINPNLVRQQMEGGIVFGLTAALYGGIDIRAGRVQQGNFHQQPLLRLPDCPAIRCEIVASTAPPEGIGEPGTPPVAPAVANAVFALTGQRLRTLPLKLS